MNWIKTVLALGTLCIGAIVAQPGRPVSNTALTSSAGLFSLPLPQMVLGLGVAGLKLSVAGRLLGLISDFFVNRGPTGVKVFKEFVHVPDNEITTQAPLQDEQVWDDEEWRNWNPDNNPWKPPQPNLPQSLGSPPKRPRPTIKGSRPVTQKPTRSTTSRPVKPTNLNRRPYPRPAPYVDIPRYYPLPSPIPIHPPEDTAHMPPQDIPKSPVPDQLPREKPSVQYLALPKPIFAEISPLRPQTVMQHAFPQNLTESKQENASDTKLKSNSTTNSAKLTSSLRNPSRDNTGLFVPGHLSVPQMTGYLNNKPVPFPPAAAKPLNIPVMPYTNPTSYNSFPQHLQIPHSGAPSKIPVSLPAFYSQAGPQPWMYPYNAPMPFWNMMQQQQQPNGATFSSSNYFPPHFHQPYAPSPWQFPANFPFANQSQHLTNGSFNATLEATTNMEEKLFPETTTPIVSFQDNETITTTDFSITDTTSIIAPTTKNDTDLESKTRVKRVRRETELRGISDTTQNPHSKQTLRLDTEEEQTTLSTKNEASSTISSTNVEVEVPIERTYGKQMCHLKLVCYMGAEGEEKPPRTYPQRVYEFFRSVRERYLSWENFAKMFVTNSGETTINGTANMEQFSRAFELGRTHGRKGCQIRFNTCPMNVINLVLLATNLEKTE